MSLGSRREALEAREALECLPLRSLPSRASRALRALRAFRFGAYLMFPYLRRIDGSGTFESHVASCLPSCSSPTNKTTPGPLIPGPK